MQQLTEQQAADYVALLYRLEQNPECPRAIIHLRPFSAYLLISSLQLAMRHPGLSETQADILNSIISQIMPLFAGTPGEQLLETGNHPEFDIPRTCQYPRGPHAPECPPGGHLAFNSEPWNPS